MAMEIESVTAIISQVGFPIFVAVYMLIKGSRDSADLKTAVNELTTAIKVMTERDVK